MPNNIEQYNLDIFIQGDTIDLCIPTEEFASNSTWYEWFNDFKTTRFLDQGIYPNTPQKQLEFLKTFDKDNRVSFIVSDKVDYVGTISLSFIDLYKKTADIALLFGEKSTSTQSDLIALESIALVTAYAFDTIGLERISAGQHIKLSKWQNKMELIGYRLEGIKRNAFIKGRERSDSVFIGCLYDDYFEICKRRGRIWDGYANMKGRIKKLPEERLIDRLVDFHRAEAQRYYQSIFNL